MGNVKLRILMPISNTILTEMKNTAIQIIYP